MKALIIEGIGKAEWKEVAPMMPGPGEVLSRVLYTATCPHWDMHLFRGKPMFPGMKLSYPITTGKPGHEMSGEVVAVGEGVTDLKVGDRIATWRDEGIEKNGTYGEYSLQESSSLLKIPRERDPLEYASLELAMCVASTVLDIERYAPLRGKKIFVQGLGPAGLVALQMAKACGAAFVYAVDINRARFPLAEKLGADGSLDPSTPEVAGLSRNSPHAPDVIIDCVGIAKAVNWAIRASKEIVALFGVQREDYVYPNGSWNGLKIFGYPGHFRESAEWALDLITQGRLDLKPLYSRIDTFENYQDAVETLERQEAVKILFKP